MTAHGLHDSVNILRRWSQHHDGPLPGNWKQFQEQNTRRAMEIEQTDPQLVSLLKGTASAGLRADALTGKFSPTAPTAEQVAKAQRQARIQELYDAKPYADGRMVNMTAAMELDHLAPEVGAKARREASYMDPTERDAQAAADRQSKENWHRQMAAQAQLRSLQNQAAGRF